MRKSLVWGLALLAGSAAHADVVDFETFYIRNNNGSIVSPWDADMSVVENANEDGFSAMTPRSGQKVGYGTSAFDGFQLNDLQTVDWDKVSGASNVAYLNIWVTDGLGNYAIISSENDYRGTNFSTRTEWKIFEFGGTNYNDVDATNDFSWLFNSGTGGRTNQYLTLNGNNATLSDLKDGITVFAGPVGPTPGVGTGAPRGGYGFNLIYGDTQSNFLGAYHLENLEVQWNGTTYEAGAVVPLPAPLALGMVGMAIAGVAARRRKKA